MGGRSEFSWQGGHWNPASEPGREACPRSQHRKRSRWISVTSVQVGMPGGDVAHRTAGGAGAWRWRRWCCWPGSSARYRSRRTDPRTPALTRTPVSTPNAAADPGRTRISTGSCPVRRRFRTSDAEQDVTRHLPVHIRTHRVPLRARNAGDRTGDPRCPDDSHQRLRWRRSWRSRRPRCSPTPARATRLGGTSRSATSTRSASAMRGRRSSSEWPTLAGEASTSAARSRCPAGRAEVPCRCGRPPARQRWHPGSTGR
jgi:hypothetical protein